LLLTRRIWSAKKEITRQLDRLRGEASMIADGQIEKNYIFDGLNGKRPLRDLFAPFKIP
jgi:predicted dithiol-disulfide oxidoreductase (DUF899 family)